MWDLSLYKYNMKKVNEPKCPSPLLFVLGKFCSDLRNPCERSLSAAASFKTASLRSLTLKTKQKTLS